MSGPFSGNFLCLDIPQSHCSILASASPCLAVWRQCSPHYCFIPRLHTSSCIILMTSPNPDCLMSRHCPAPALYSSTAISLTFQHVHTSWFTTRLSSTSRAHHIISIPAGRAGPREQATSNSTTWPILVETARHHEYIDCAVRHLSAFHPLEHPSRIVCLSSLSIIFACILLPELLSKTI